MLGEDVVIALPGAGLENVIREPRLLDVLGEGHAPALWVIGSAGGSAGLDLLPGPVRVTPGGERAGRSLALRHVSR